MAIKTSDPSKNKLIEYPIIEFLSDEKLFKIASYDSEFSISYIPDLDDSFTEKNFDVKLFYNEHLNAENNIYQVYLQETNRRIGWIFPIQALLSTEHDYASHVHFLKYSFVAHHILLTSDMQQKTPTLSTEHNLLDFYHDNTIILVLSKEKIGEIVNFNIDEYLCSFADFGYYLADELPKPTRSQPTSVQEYFTKFKKYKRITLAKTSPIFSSHFYIIELYKKLLYSNDHHLIRFHLLYQVIELAIERIFEMSFDSMLETFQNGDIGLFDFKEKLNNSLSEKERISRLISVNSLAPKIIEDLHRECNNILKIIDSEKDSLNGSLYRVRNLIVHSYRQLTNKDVLIKQMGLINFRLELFISELLKKYRDPS